MDSLIAKNEMEYLEGSEVKARLNDKSRIVGSNLIRADGVSVLKDAEYTPCKEEEYLIDNCPGWKLKSSKIFHDFLKQKQFITTMLEFTYLMFQLFTYLIFFSPRPISKKKIWSTNAYS